MSWENFEEEQYKYLKKMYSAYAKITHIGGADSTQSDIYIEPKNKENFWVEVKESSSQSGQFVLLANNSNETFEYSGSNKTPINSYSRRIIEYMNSCYTVFNRPRTSGNEISFPGCEKVFYNWIIEKYRDKGVKFIITEGNTIIKLENISSCFDVSATYRWC